MTLVFGAIPPVAMVLALPILLPSVPAEKVVIDSDDENYGDDDDNCQISENCKRRRVLGNKYLVYMINQNQNRGEIRREEPKAPGKSSRLS